MAELPTASVTIACSDFRYIEDTIDIIAVLVHEYSMEGIVVILNKATREFAYYLEQRGVGLGGIHFIDCNSIISGKGTPPIPNCIALNNPTQYENILFYTLVTLRKLTAKPRFVVFVSSRMFLTYDDFNEVAVFFKIYTDRMKKEKIACLIPIQKASNYEFEALLERITDVTYTYEDWMEAFSKTEVKFA